MRFKALPNIALPLLLAIAAWLLAATSATASTVPVTAAWTVFETSIETTKAYARPFVDVEVDAIFEKGDTRWRVPAFWSGGGTWKVRFAPPEAGEYRYRFVSNDTANADFAAPARTFVATPAAGDNPLLRRGFLRVSADARHFEHADGTPFLWLGDTWWKGLCKRIDLAGFDTLCTDRAAKGFNVVQIVCGPYPDENMLEPRWENEAGMPYTTLDFTAVNPAYFDAADARIAKLVAHGIVPAIVGGWGRPQSGGQSTINQVGLDGFKRHWRHLIARYGAMPVVWILGGEASDGNGPWAELAEYVRATDPYRHPLTYHAPGDPRSTIRAGNDRFDFDMVAIGHDGLNTANETLRLLRASLDHAPVRPALCGEACYERHMQTNFEDIQRHLFWTLMLSGAAGHTYGAAGIWHSSIEGDPGITPIYDFTTWREGMAFPGSAQLGLAKKLLEELPWHRMQPHPEWVDGGAFAAGIAGELLVAYLPKRGIYNWSGFRVLTLDPNARFEAFWFDPASGRRFPIGTVSDESSWSTPPVPSPQDWVLVMRRETISGSAPHP